MTRRRYHSPALCEPARGVCGSRLSICWSGNVLARATNRSIGELQASERGRRLDRRSVPQGVCQQRLQPGGSPEQAYSECQPTGGARVVLENLCKALWTVLAAKFSAVEQPTAVRRHSGAWRASAFFGLLPLGGPSCDEEPAKSPPTTPSTSL